MNSEPKPLLSAFSPTSAPGFTRFPFSGFPFLKHLLWLPMLSLALLYSPLNFANDSVNTKEASALSEVRKISEEIQSLKQEVVMLNKDLRLMEETLLFPSSTQFSVFVSVSSGRFFTLESIKLKIDGKLVSTHLYDEKQRQALTRGGVQKLHLTNLNNGQHSVTVFFTGVGPNGRDYKRAIDYDLTKETGSSHMELIITDDGKIQEPIFRIKQW